MASSSMVALALLLSLALVVPSALGGVICEELPQDVCAFAISSSSRRCVLETTPEGTYQCQTSEVVVRTVSEWIETDDCVRTCGVDRFTVGLSASAILDRNFVEMLCSPGCYHNCHNIVDLYATLAAGEGVSLPDLCLAQHASTRRMMAEISPIGSPVGAPAAAPV